MKSARWLVNIGSSLLLLTGLLHAYNYRFAVPKIASSNIGGDMLGVFKVLWLAMSVECVLVALVIFAASRLANGRTVVLLGTTIPAVTAGLMFHFIGAFVGSTLLSIATLFLLIGGWMLPKARESHPASRMW